MQQGMAEGTAQALYLDAAQRAALLRARAGVAAPAACACWR